MSLDHLCLLTGLIGVKSLPSHSNWEIGAPSPSKEWFLRTFLGGKTNWQKLEDLRGRERITIASFLK